jgi:membrane protease YdiL (CAAX protease family)
MITDKETGIAPAIRVLRHFKERQLLYPIKFESGERALVLIAGMPVPSIEVVRLGLGGLIPSETVWTYNAMRAGGYSDYIRKLKAMFSPTIEGFDDCVQHVRDALLRCQSLQEARALLLKLERLANNATSEVVGFPSHPPTSTTTNDDWELGISSSHNEAAPQTIETSGIPNRYQIRNAGQGKGLTCAEAPMVTVRAEHGLTVSAKQTRKYPPGTIFLDGVAEGDPFVDIEKELYNIDHPPGCIRSLATCEQAILLIRKVLDLRKREWVVLVNDADVDTVLALWVLLNHLRLNSDAEVRAKAMPLLRLEGVIDAHGTDVQDLAALPPDLLRSTSATLKQLHRQEIVFERNGRWSEIDLLEYIADRLHSVDEVIYSPEDFEGLHEIEELARAELASGSVALACRSEAGIDEVERQLRTIYGECLGILIFQKTASTYRIRQVDRRLPTALEQTYKRLNLLDPEVRGDSENRWHDSAEMGVSPRKTGTGLTPTELVEAVRQAFWEPTLVGVVSEIPRVVFLALAPLLPALALISVGNLLRDRGYITGGAVLLSAIVFTTTVGILFWLKARWVPGIYGWRPAAGFDWLIAVPAGFIGAATGGVWVPGSLAYRIEPHNLYDFSTSAALLFSLGAELLYRGVILGDLASRLPIQNSSAPWCSWPTLISTALYAVASLLLFLSCSSGQLQISQWLLIVAGAVIFGIASGIARERSESILSSVLLHWVCAAALLLFRSF